MKYSLIPFLLILPVFLYAQDRNAPGPGEKAPVSGQASHGQDRKVSGHRSYQVAVMERSDEEQARFSALLAKELNRSGSRGLAADIFNSYRKQAGDLFTEAAGRAVNVAVNYAVDNVRSKRGKWQKAVAKESRFTKEIKMPSEIHHFYKDVSNIGPMDPTGMVFDGFSCIQVIDVEGQSQTVFKVVCKVRQDAEGLQLMASDSRFQVYVDEVEFNPYLCDIPNDSLSNVDYRIPFDFQKRKDLNLKIRATVTSTWMNQILQITRDQVLGTFDIDVSIDPKYVVTDSTGASVFLYKFAPDNPANARVRVNGDCFVVPRSYVASKADGDIWGMGQYKVDVVVTESCNINREYYMKEGKKDEWNEAAWKPEWEKIKQRPKKSGFWKDMLDAVTQGWSNGQWVIKATSPFTSYVIKSGSTFINGGTGSTPAGTSSKANSSTPSAQPSGFAGKPAGGDPGKGPGGK